MIKKDWDETDWNGPDNGEKLVPFEDDEIARKLIRVSRSDKSRKLSVSASVRQRILHAVVLIHNQARYYEGMSILCAMAGMRPRILENGYDSPEEQIRTRKHFNDWIKSLTKG